MAAITKSLVKTRSRGFSTRKVLFCGSGIVLVCIFLMRGMLFWDEDFLIDSMSLPIQSIQNEKSTSNRAAPIRNKGASSSSSSSLLIERQDRLALQRQQYTNFDFPKSNADNFHRPTAGDGKNVYIYHHTLRSSSGKEGAVILDMLMGHAYAYHQGAIYGGSCGEGNDVGREKENLLIKAVGLQDFLQFACPRDLETKDRKKVVPEKSYIQDGTRIFTPEYMDILKGILKYPMKQEDSKTNIIVVHISRGKKITPCRKAVHKGYEPYLPNKHYQLLINKYSKPEHENKVIIYSQSEYSFETFDGFREKGYELHIDEPVKDVWMAAITSDIFIMSRSSFSFVPAMAISGTSTTVVYTPFWDQPIRGWEIVRKDIQAQSDAEFQRLKSTCPKTDKLEKFRKNKNRRR